MLPGGSTALCCSCKTYVAAKSRFKSVDKMWLFAFLEQDGLTVIFDTLNSLSKQKVIKVEVNLR